MGKYDRPGYPKALELRELQPAIAQGDRDAFIRAMKVGVFLHARNELKLPRAQAMEMVGAIPWDNIQVKFTLEGQEEAGA